MRSCFPLALALTASACSVPPPAATTTSSATSAPAAPSVANATAPTASGEQPVEDIRVEIRTRADWIEVRGAPKGNHSAVPVHRALRPEGKPYDMSFSVVGTDPVALERGFVVDKKKILLGEPLLVALQVRLKGAGKWKETLGGNYRGRGRDDNFAFVLRAADGSIKSDPYARQQFGMGGGISYQHEVTSSKPLSYWRPVQRYAVLDAPGTYDLYCFHYDSSHHSAGWRQALADAIPTSLKGHFELAPEGNGLVAKGSGAKSPYQLSPSSKKLPSPSPLAALVPKSIATHAQLQPEGITDYAHFRIEVVKPTAAERAKMVADWTKAVAKHTQSMPTSHADAGRAAMWFARQDDFLPLIESWLKAGKGYAPQDLGGLAMRSSPKAAALLLDHAGENGLGALHWLPDERVRHVMPKVIERLTAADAPMRAQAFSLIAGWTGERFGAGWPGYHHQRPTPEEGAALRPRVEAWWKAHAAGFKPKPRSY